MAGIRSDKFVNIIDCAFVRLLIGGLSPVSYLHVRYVLLDCDVALKGVKHSFLTSVCMTLVFLVEKCK